MDKSLKMPLRREEEKWLTPWYAQDCRVARASFIGVYILFPYFLNDLYKPKMKAELHKFAQIHKLCAGCVDKNNRLVVYNYMMFAFLV